MRVARLCFLTFVVLPSFLSAVGCTSRKQADLIRFQMGGEPSTLEPWKATDVYANNIIRNTNEGLFKLDGDGRIQNGLAASYALSSDRLQYRFKLRDARWSDGVPVTIENFIEGLRHSLDPKTVNPSAEYLFSIKNGFEIYRGLKPVESLGVRREGDELVIDLKQPDPLLPLSLTGPAGAPLRKDVYEKAGGKWEPTHPTTGAYRIESYKTADEINLVPNRFSATPGRKPVNIKILPEESTAMNLLESGRIDIASTISISEIARLEKVGLIRKVPSTTVFYVSFNTSRKPFSDVIWRKAVASSFDREGMKRALNGTYEPVTSMVAPSIAGALPYSPMKDEVAVTQVREIKRKPRLTMMYGPSDFTKIVAEKIQADLQRHLNLDIELQPTEFKTFLARLRSDPPDLFLIGMSALFDDPFPQLTSFSSRSQPNYARYVSERFEKELAEMIQAPIGPERTRLAEEANRTLVIRDVAVVPLLLRTQVYGVSKGLKGFRLSPFSTVDFGQMDK